MKLLCNGILKLICGFLLMGLCLFLPAGTIHYPGGWLFLVLLFIPMVLLGGYLFFRAPDLLQKRLNGRERERTQSFVVAASGLVFLASFLLAGFDFRFGWSRVPSPLVILGALLLLASYGLYARVMQENAYLSRTIEVQEGQKVIDTGLYATVRHPMYTATIFLFLSMTLVLGSWISFCMMLLYPVLIVLRIRNEEQVLKAGLVGYEDYCRRVKYRLLPHIW